MAERPATLCKLKKGKLIDVNEGFVDTYNWMVDYINNLKGDDNNIEVDTSTSDHPKIKWIGDNDSGGGITIVGTDGSSAKCSGDLTFEAMENCNLSVHVEQTGQTESSDLSSDTGAGPVTVKIGVFYV